MPANDSDALDPVRADAFVARLLDELGTAFHLPTVVVGDRLGLYLAMADGSPVTAAELAERTGTDVGYVAQWLDGQVAAAYLEHDGELDAFRLPPEHAAALVEGRGPVFIPAGFQMAASMARDEPLVTEAFRTGRTVPARGRDPDLSVAGERFAHAARVHQLISRWLPALDGVVTALQAGIDVADLGCGRGSAVVLMAQAYPASRFTGVDTDPAAVADARRAAEAAGVSRRVRFAVATEAELPAGCYRLVTSFDRLDNGRDPAATAAAVRSCLDADGTWMVVEPNEHDAGAKAWRNAATMVSPPAPVLGIRTLVTGAGFTRVRTAASTALQVVYEVRP